MSSALLLAAGKATRLKNVRDRFAKACVPIAGVTPLQFLIHHLHRHGVDELWINLHWQKEQVRSHAAEVAPPDMKLHFLQEDELLGTGGTLLQCAHQRGALPDLVLNAKMFTNINFTDVLRAPTGTLVLHPSSDLQEFGGLRYDNDGFITGLLLIAEAQSQSVQAGVFTGVSRPHHSWLQNLEESTRSNLQPPLCLLRHGVFPAIAKGIPCSAYLHDGWWCEISTPERMQAAEILLNSTEQKRLLKFDLPRA